MPARSSISRRVERLEARVGDDEVPVRVFASFPLGGISEAEIAQRARGNIRVVRGHRVAFLHSLHPTTLDEWSARYVEAD